VGYSIGVAGQQLIEHGAVRRRHDRMQQRSRGNHQYARIFPIARIEE
jgi:hypothetical protein